MAGRKEEEEEVNRTESLKCIKGIRQLYSFDGVGMNQEVREVRQSAFGIKKGCLMTSAPER